MDARPGLLGTPLGQFGLGAIALVIGGALLFTMIGAVSSDGEDTTPTAGETTTDAPDTEAATDAPTGTSTDGTDGTDGVDDTATDGATGTPTETDTGTATDTEPEATEPEFEPGDVSIQVLDAVGDGGTTHGAVMDCLAQAGYDDLIPNSASRIYTSTTVFFTPGEDNQAMAQQAADVLGVGVVEEKPGNLSDSVPVHIVVGEDGGDLC